MTTAKRAAGEYAAILVEPGMRLGLGTGSTIAFFLEALAKRDLADVAGLPTSTQTEQACAALGIKTLAPSEVTSLDLAIDGADELTAGLHLTKGGGGALLREKVVAGISERFVVVGTEGKLVDRLGITFPIPIEAVPFSSPLVAARLLREFDGSSAQLRDEGGYLTDNGNQIIDLTLPQGVEDPERFEAITKLIPGVCEVGVFASMADSAILADDSDSNEQPSVRTLEPVDN